MVKVDLKKRFKPLYSPRASFHRVVSEGSPYVAIRSKGVPGAQEFQEAVEKIYGVAYTLKFHLKKAGVLDFAVPPLETRYFDDPAEVGMENLTWQLLVRIPEEVTSEQVEEAKRIAGEKKGVDLSEIERVELDEGACIQITHIGPYRRLGETYARLGNYLAENRLVGNGPPHEVYLNDPRRCAPERLKTVIRIPIQDAAR